MGQTSPDLLPWPETSDPAMVPQDMQELAAATQAAIDKRMNASYTAAACTYQSGWVSNTDSYGGLVLYKTGKLVIARGKARRSSNMTVADNTLYQIGAVPPGYRPAVWLAAAGAWAALAAGEFQNMVTQLVVSTDGDIHVLANTAATIRATTDWVSIAGLSWMTA